jgi:hypothetical protein
VPMLRGGSKEMYIQGIVGLHRMASRGSKVCRLYVDLKMDRLNCADDYGSRPYSFLPDSKETCATAAVEKLTKDPRISHSRDNRFPKNFEEIYETIWQLCRLVGSLDLGAYLARVWFRWRGVRSFPLVSILASTIEIL